jgi:fructose-1,6-bisphosphatase-3
MRKMELKYLKLLAKEYKNIEAVSGAIVNLGAKNTLPKGTEFFFSDLHGEHEAFLYLLRSASGVIKAKIDSVFGKFVTEEEREQLANLIYYPEEYLNTLNLSGQKLIEWQKLTIYRLILVCQAVSSKYTRAKVRSKMPEEFTDIFDELLNVNSDVDKEQYYEAIISSIVSVEISDKFIIAICSLIRSISVDSLHIIGDIFDRGPRADIIMEELIHFHDADIQWGNHDVSWMGSATGNRALIANVIRMAISYNNFDVLEDGYGINLRALAIFASEVYKDDPCELFSPHVLDINKYDPVDMELAAKMHKAITVIQLKLEGQLLERHPEYHMADRVMLKNIDYKKGTVRLDGVEYPLKDTRFETVDPAAPLKLTKREEELMKIIAHSFDHSYLLNKHVKFLYSNGSMYKTTNGNLLYHGCIPMKEDGSFDSMCFDGKEYAGKKLLDYINLFANKAYFSKRGTKEQKKASDFMWYLWCGPKSPVFGKSKLSYFEHYFIEDPKTRQEIMNPYYSLSQKEEICKKILKEFGMSDQDHIINGHVPVKLKEGESPIKANGRLFVIDGGISKAYRTKTGIAGYTLIYNSHALNLAEHTAKEYGKMVTPNVMMVEKMERRVTVADTDYGDIIREQIADLKELLEAYRKGIIKERF